MTAQPSPEQTRQCLALMLLMAGKNHNVVRGALTAQYDRGSWFRLARMRLNNGIKKVLA